MLRDFWFEIIGILLAMVALGVVMVLGIVE
jgi:uncharacterized membrane protein